MDEELNEQSRIICAIIGCGNISDIYIKNLKRFPIIELKYCSDIITEKAVEKAEKYNLKYYSLSEIYNDSNDIQLIVNLTNPSSHFEVSLRAIESGKHVYSEKPLTTTYKDAKLLVEKAKEKRLYIGCAPDTFFGSPWQTSKKLIEEKWIGNPISATAFMLCRGHESWHPSPEFYYQRGGGPLFDMGPYYLTTLVFLLGPIEEVFAYGKTTFNKRTITSKDKFGSPISVEVLTHITALIKFEKNVLCTMIMSFDTWGHKLPYIEIYGEYGSLSLPDPNCFNGPISYYNQYNQKWIEFPTYYDIFENLRGIGVADMVKGILKKGEFRANSEVALHILEVMEKILESAERGKSLNIETSCKSPSLIKETDYPVTLPS
ncbi:MAG: Gfo/Idh/MocA family oxidoreductase [Candidatus Hydrogenedentes bacterium]|nr:Gfo/Idh/MocA family oxidoreductase [Candidatus Hydrogenedentota bacterium]